MSFSQNALLILSCAGILQAVLLALIVFFFPRGDRSVNAFLAMYLVSFSIPMTAPVVLEFSTWHNVIIYRSVLLLSGPLLYLYVMSFRRVITFRMAWPHFVLFVFQVIMDVRLYVTSIDQFPPADQLPSEIIYHPVSISLVIMRLMQMLFYFFAAQIALTSYQKSIQHIFSDTSRISLSWVRWLINGNLALLLAMAAIYSIVLTQPQEFKFYAFVNTSLVTVYIYLVTYKGVTQPTLWQVQKGMSHEKVEQEMLEAESIEASARGDRKARMPKPNVNQEKTSEIVSRAIELMEKEKLFRESELTLQDLADRIQLPAYQVSQAINDGMKKTFYDLVNSYRVEEAKRLLLDPKTRNHKILALGHDAGFNSKTTFNTVFKKFTGHSPSDFREIQKAAV